MTGAVLSYAQSLRVIGQDLAGLGIRTFELGKFGDEYVVEVERGAPRDKQREKGLLERISDKFNSVEETANVNPLRFSRAKILGADLLRQAQRTDAGAVPDTGNLSVKLRVLGDFLDKKAAVEFGISYSGESVRVGYDRKVEHFTTQNLYDLGVRMYLRRSNRSPAR